jgi:hypothetical protein
MTSFKLTPDPTYLHECFIVDENDPAGRLIWRERPAHHFSSVKQQQAFNRRWAGKHAGSVAKQAYGPPRMYVKINGLTHQYGRIVWAMTRFARGWFGVIDHIDGNPLNNHHTNLREVNFVQNGQNRTHKSKTVSGVTGVNLCNKTGKWRAGVTLNKKFVWLGYHDHIEQAIHIVLDFKRKNFGDFARHA